MAQSKAKVFLIGAGPGDPDLLTVKALRLLQQAEVVVYDRLVSEEIMACVPEGTTRMFVGKRDGCHYATQDEINHLLVQLAESGRTVARVKGGDPLIFGRGSEEMLHLKKNGVCFEVVPGITAASGCSAYAGIPLTHRGLANGFRIITGHSRDGIQEEIDYQAIAQEDTTLVLYMSLGKIDSVIKQLLVGGLPSSTPVAAIENGTTRRQKVAIGTLTDISVKLKEGGFCPPTLIIIGKVVGLSNTLEWWNEQQKTGELVDQSRSAMSGER